jgi:glycosyltransferase involved in cell wall biosynthesis
VYKAGINTSSWQNQAGTALGTAFLIDELREKFNSLVESCDRVIVIAKWYRGILLANGVPETKISYVAQGLPFDAAIQTQVEKEVASKPIRLMFLGRIDPLKGLHLLLEAAKDIPEDKFELDIFGQPGDAAYEKEWRGKTSTLQSVKWKGRLRQEDVVRTMREYDALCLCSTFSEMSPLVIQEAFAAGIPVIASNVYGNTEQISHGENGLLFQFNDSASLRDQLLRSMDEPRSLQEMKRNVRAPRSFAQVGDEYLRIYQALVAEGQGHR